MYANVNVNLMEESAIQIKSGITRNFDETSSKTKTFITISSHK